GGTLRHERLGDAAADPARAAGDDGDAAVQTGVGRRRKRGRGRMISQSSRRSYQRSRLAFQHRARTTTLNNAPPLEKLLTSAIGPGASMLAAARRSVAACGSGSVRPAIGGTRPM